MTSTSPGAGPAPRVRRALVLAGGRGSRLGAADPKPITPVAGRPMIEWVIRMLEHAGIEHTTIATGHFHDRVATCVEQLVTSCSVEVRRTEPELDTGARVRAAVPARPAEPLVLTWCDSLTRLDLPAMLDTHARAGALVTMLAVHPPSRFGHVHFEGDRVARFDEKPSSTGEWINAGVFIVEPAALELIPDRADASWERDLLPALLVKRALAAHRSERPWRCLDHEHERHALEHALRKGLLGEGAVD